MQYLRFASVLCLSLLIFGCSIENTEGMMEKDSAKNENANFDSISALYYRQDDGSIAEAPQEEVELVNDYLSKHPTSMDQELVLLSTSSVVKQNDEVRVIHLYRTNTDGKELLVNGPKEIYDEYVDGDLATESAATPDYPWTVLYDGRMLSGPGTDSGFDITRYSFEEKGEHSIVWKVGGLVSNELKIIVE